MTRRAVLAAVVFATALSGAGNVAAQEHVDQVPNDLMTFVNAWDGNDQELISTFFSTSESAQALLHPDLVWEYKHGTWADRSHRRTYYHPKPAEIKRFDEELGVRTLTSADGTLLFVVERDEALRMFDITGTGVAVETLRPTEQKIIGMVLEKNHVLFWQEEDEKSWRIQMIGMLPQ